MGDEWDDDDEDDLGSTVVTESPFFRMQREAETLQKDRAYLITIAGPETGKIHKLSQGEFTLGRSKRADVQLDDDSISRVHAKVTLVDHVVMVEDLGSVNGTYVNGQAIGSKQLADGDKIRIGETTILKFGIQDALDEQFQQKLYEAALRDDLTQAFNKKYLIDHLAKEFRYALRHRSVLSLLMLDIDHFKHFNDTYGHVAGDQILSQLGTLVQATLRAEDLFARYGGEEFTIVARGIKLDQAHMLGERVRVYIASTPFEAAGQQLHVTMSIGVAELAHNVMTEPTQLIEAADTALYQAKRGGRNCVQSFRG
jgi:two-component system cell cycle response regulator